MLSTLEENFSGLTRRRLERNAIRQDAELHRIEVDCLPFAEAMDRFGITAIDFLSIDTEGGELDILKGVDFSRHPVRVISVENNYFRGDIRDYLATQGFLHLGTFKVDEIYVHKDLGAAA
jgi:hypothetical protein